MVVKEKTQTIFRKLPAMARALCWKTNGGWIIGGAAKYLLGEVEGTPRDWDILIPFPSWAELSLIIPEEAGTNSFRGFKFQADDVEYDVWPGDLGWLLLQAKCDIIAVHPYSERVLRCTNIST